MIAHMQDRKSIINPIIKLCYVLHMYEINSAL